MQFWEAIDNYHSFGNEIEIFFDLDYEDYDADYEAAVARYEQLVMELEALLEIYPQLNECDESEEYTAESQLSSATIGWYYSEPITNLQQQTILIPYSHVYDGNTSVSMSGNGSVNTYTYTVPFQSGSCYSISSSSTVQGI